MGKIAALLPLGFIFLFKIEYTVAQCSSMVGTNDVDLSQNDWFAKYTPEFTRGDLHIYKFASDGDLTMESAVSNIVTDTFTCLSEHEVVPIKYYLYDQGGTKYCGSIFSYDDTLMMMSMAQISVAQASNCPPLLSGQDVAILGRRDHTYMDVSACSDAIPYREYLVEVSDSNEKDQCKDVQSSTATMTSSGLTISSCIAGASYSYATPYINVNIQCAGVMSPTITGNNQAQGSIVIWRYADRNDAQLYSFYCSFAHIDTATNSIIMSMDVSNEMLPACRTISSGEKGYLRVNSTDDGTFIKFLLKANDCNPSKCLNGGTCTQSSMLNYTCACLPGFKGWRCETNINDCSPSSCMNGGTCVDEVTKFSCRCPSFFTGDTCQWHTCVMPERYVDEWQYLRNGTLGSFTFARPSSSGSSLFQYDSDIGPDIRTFCNQAKLMDWFPVFVNESFDESLCFHFNIPLNEDNGILFYKTLPPAEQYLTSPASPLPDYPVLENRCADASLDTDVYVSIRTSPPVRVNCPFHNGVYEDSGVAMFGDPLTNCTEDTTIYGDTITSCEMVLKCVANYTAKHMWGEADNTKGDILVYQDIANDHIYCGRYKAEGNGVKMSHFNQAFSDGTMDKYPYGNVCKQTTEFDTIDELHSHCAFKSNGCKLNPCKNDGTCTAGFQDYSCACSSGWTGTNCQTDIDECAGMPCQNGGTCNEWDGVDFYNCTCPPGYSGVHCEKYDECHFNPCLNGGTCTDVDGTQMDNYRCQCVAGWTGNICQTDFDECASSPCINSGTCTDLLNSFKCTCFDFNSGDICQTNINECDSTPCLNGGTCNDRHLGYACYCPPAWRGVHCEEYNNCHNYTCLHGGTCQDDFKKAHCFCTEGWTGKWCETDNKPSVIRCEPTNPCQNGGTCVEDGNTFACSCPADLGVLDQLCMPITPDTTPPPEEGLDTVTTVIIVIASVIAAIVMAVIIFFAVKACGAASGGAGGGAGGAAAQSVRPPPTMYSNAYKGGQGPYRSF